MIRNNIIRRAGFFCPAPFLSQAGAIPVTAGASWGHLRPAGIYDGVLIEDNKVIEVNGPNLVVSSARDVTISGNHFVDPQQAPPNDTGRDFGIPNDCVIWVGDSDHVRLVDNQIKGTGRFARKEVVIDPSAKNVTNTGPPGATQ